MESCPGYTVMWGKSKVQKNAVCCCLYKWERGRLGKHTCVCSFVKQTSHTQERRVMQRPRSWCLPEWVWLGERTGRKGRRGALCLHVHLTVVSFWTKLYFAICRQQGRQVGQSGTDHRKHKLIVCFVHPHQGRAKGMRGTHLVTSEQSLWPLHP